MNEVREEFIPLEDRRLKVAAYCRISSDKDVSAPSLNEQIDHYTRLIIQTRNWDYAGIYYDDGISGTTIYKRKGFMKMIEAAKAGHIDLILVKSLSRFSRNLIDLLTIVRDLRNKNVGIQFEDQGINTLDNKSDQMITIYAKFAEMEATTSSERANWRLNVDRKNGHYRLPVEHMMGYRYDENGNVVIEESEAKTIRLIYRLYLEGMGTVTIANYLKNNGYKNRRGTTSWSVTGVNNILTNEKYIGNCVMQKTYIKDPLSKKKMYNHGDKLQYLVENGHPPIIDKDTFERVEQLMEKKRKQYRLHSYANGDTGFEQIRTPYAGFFLCPYCGKNYVVRTNHYNGKVSNRFLTCYSNINNKVCKSENYPLDTMKMILAKQIQIIKSNLSSFKEALKDVYKVSLEDNHEKEINALNEQIETLRNKYESIKDYQDDFFTNMKNEIISQINDLVEERSSYQNKISTKEEYDEKIKEIVNAFKDFPDEYDDIGDTDFKSLFSKGVVVNKGLIYFIIGNSDIKLPLKPKLLFKSSIEYKVRITTFTTQFGVLINK